MLPIFIVLHIVHFRSELHMWPHLPTIRLYHNDIVLYCILSIQQSITLADKTCELPHDGVRTPKYVAVIWILILYYFLRICWYTNKYLFIEVFGYERKNKTGYSIKNTIVGYDIGILLWLHISVFL